MFKKVFPLCLILLGSSYCLGSDQTSLEEALASGDMERWQAAAKRNAEQTVKPKSVSQLRSELEEFENVYVPEKGKAPFPTLILLHGCSGPTPSHEQDWAKRLNQAGIAVIAPDSFAGRAHSWKDACDAKVMTPWERSGDIVATIESLKDRAYADAEKVYIAGFSHGAITAWTFMQQLSEGRPPLSVQEYPETNYQSAIHGAFLFYGSCKGKWDVEIETVAFLGSDDRYIDETTCVEYAKMHPERAGSFEYTVYAGATHTFDHASPNQANIEAGSRYDARATEAAWQRMRSLILDSEHE